MNNLQLRNEDCFYEFEIIQRDNTTDCDSYSSSTGDSTQPEVNMDPARDMCYICNIEVPVVCMSEHLSSSKHKTFLKIAEISLERVKKQMFVSYKAESPPAGFIFCHSCVHLVHQRDMSQHLNCKAHKNAEFIDKLLSDLLKVYSDESDGADEAESANASSVQTSANSFESFNCDDSRVIENANTSANIKDTVDNTKKKVENGEISTCTCNSKVVTKTASETGKSNTKNGKIADNSSGGEGNTEIEGIYNFDINNGKKMAMKCLPVRQDFNKKLINSFDTDLADYMRELNTKDCNNLEVVDDCDIVVKTKLGLRMRVKLENFHGLFALGKRHMLCSLCKKIDRDLKRHIHSQAHLDNLRLPIDENCIRKLDDEKGHCILCNDVIENPDVHALCSRGHEALLKRSLLTDEVEPIAEEITTSQAEATDRREPFRPDPAHPKSERSNEEGQVQTASEPSARAESETTEQLLCNVCYVSIEDLLSHVQTPEHESNLALASHHLLEYSHAHRTLKCKVCQTGFPVGHMREHVSSPFHQNSYKKLLVTNKMTRSRRSLFCSVCVAYMPIGEELFHMSSAKHASLSAACRETATVPAKPTNEPHFCKICSVHVPGDAKNLKTHNDGARHKRNLELADATAKDGGRVEPTDGAPPRLQHPHLMRPTAKPTQVECSVCATVLPNTSAHIESHINLYAHKNNESTLRTNTLKLYRNLFWCGRCDGHVPVGCQFQHIESPQHTDNTIKWIVEEWVSEAKGASTTSEPEERPGPLEMNALKPTDSAGVLGCQVCGVVVPNSMSTLRMHFAGRKHRSMLEQLLAKNALKEANDMFDCSACRQRVPKEILFDHVERPSHVASVGVLAETADGEKSAQNVQKGDAKEKSDKKGEGGDNKAESVPKDQVAKKESGQKDQEFSCVVCDVQLTASEANVVVHNDGVRHKTNLVAMVQNRVRAVDGGCYCEACDKRFGRAHLNEHLADPQHLLNMGKSQF
ncbi:unnamed protein product, partial [Iphiclides podalirius]